VHGVDVRLRRRPQRIQTPPAASAPVDFGSGATARALAVPAEEDHPVPARHPAGARDLAALRPAQEVLRQVEALEPGDALLDARDIEDWREALDLQHGDLTEAYDAVDGH
jgi:hypothetical protein